MTALKRFVAQQVEIAQTQLQELPLVHPEEGRDATVPKISLRELKDDLTIQAPGWSFLKGPRNETLQGHERWLLNRVATLDWLQDEFLAGAGASLAKWKEKAARSYLQQVDAFLERLLLLVHITGGQPARGTELLSLLYCNTVHGLHRNLFIENGLVSFVTSYHKGYSIQDAQRLSTGTYPVP